jgi:hypothetical protein
VKDLGASLGRSTFPHQGTKNDAQAFQMQPFVGKVEGGIVQFDDRGRRHHDLYENISVEDVRWTCDRLAKLTPEQWLDAFRAARYDQETAAQLIGRLHQKVDEGRALR